MPSTETEDGYDFGVKHTRYHFSIQQKSFRVEFLGVRERFFIPEDGAVSILSAEEPRC